MAKEVLDLIKETEEKAAAIKVEAEKEAGEMLVQAQNDGEELLAKVEEEAKKAGHQLQNKYIQEAEQEIAEERAAFHREKERLLAVARERMEETIRWTIEKVVN